MRILLFNTDSVPWSVADAVWLPGSCHADIRVHKGWDDHRRNPSHWPDARLRSTRFSHIFSERSSAQIWNQKTCVLRDEWDQKWDKKTGVWEMNETQNETKKPVFGRWMRPKMRPKNCVFTRYHWQNVHYTCLQYQSINRRLSSISQ